MPMCGKTTINTFSQVYTCYPFYSFKLVFKKSLTIWRKKESEKLSFARQTFNCVQYCSRIFAGVLYLSVGLFWMLQKYLVERRGKADFSNERLVIVCSRAELITTTVRSFDDI